MHGFYRISVILNAKKKHKTLVISCLLVKLIKKIRVWLKLNNRFTNKKTSKNDLIEVF